jgi:hypothetical protein
MTDPNRSLLAFQWVDGFQARRPMLPSEARNTTTGVTRRLPWARADMGASRPLLPWEHSLGNDWRGITPG